MTEVKEASWRIIQFLKNNAPPWLCWWAGSEVQIDKSKFVEELKTLEFEGPRTKDLLEYSRELRKEALDGYKLSNERAEKLLGVTLIMCGWIFTSAKASTDWWATLLWIVSATAFLLAIATLMLGRWKLQVRGPGSFPAMAKYAHGIPQLGEGETADDEWQFVQARQYAIAAFETQALTAQVHRRLLLAISLLLAGLVAFALRGV